MRIISGFLLAMLCLPCDSATGLPPDMAGLAGVPIRIFDLRADGISEAFREFMSTVPMTNDRQVPAALVDDIVASLSFVKALTPPAVPAYFVAAYIHKTPLVAMPAAERNRYLERYGEAVYPQRVCPVFISRAGGVRERLSVATNLPAVWFEDVRGDPATFDRLFALTEASHCGFIARELVRPTVLPPELEPGDLRSILEALGDFEATAVARATEYDAEGADAADILFAARLLAMFLLDRENPYTAVPGLIHEYARIGVPATHRRLRRIRQSVRLARRAVRAELEVRNRRKPDSLEALAAILYEARAEGRLAPGDPLADALVAALEPSIRLLRGDRSVRAFPRPGTDPLHPLITLAGANGR